MTNHLSDDELDLRFDYHKPPDEQTAQAHERIRDKCKELATLVRDSCRVNRERSLAITKIEEAMMWANASIARFGHNTP